MAEERAYPKNFWIKWSFIFHLLERIEWFRDFKIKVNRLIVLIYGARYAKSLTDAYLAKMIAVMFLVFHLSLILAAFSQNPEVFYIGLFVTALVPFVMYKDLLNQREKKKQHLIRELPEVINKMALLVAAGETVQRALVRSARLPGNLKIDALYVELEEVVRGLKQNRPFPQLLEEFSRRCAVQEVSMFTNTVLLHYRRGGDNLVYALRDLSRMLWERRKMAARTLGEEASSKLVFPMTLMFVAILAIVVYPAVMMLQF